MERPYARGRDLFQTLGFKISKENIGRGPLPSLLLTLLDTARSREFAFCSMELSGKILRVVYGVGNPLKNLQRGRS